MEIVKFTEIIKTNSESASYDFGSQYTFEHVTHLYDEDSLMKSLRQAISMMFASPKANYMRRTFKSCMPHLKMLPVTKESTMTVSYLGEQFEWTMLLNSKGKPIRSGFDDAYYGINELASQNNDLPIVVYYGDKTDRKVNSHNELSILPNWCYEGWSDASDYIGSIQEKIMNVWLDRYRENNILQHTKDFSEQGRANIEERIQRLTKEVEFYEDYLRRVTNGCDQHLYAKPYGDHDELVLVTSGGKYNSFEDLGVHRDVVEITLDLAYRLYKTRPSDLSNGIVLINKKVYGVERIVKLFPQFQFIINE